MFPPIVAIQVQQPEAETPEALRKRLISLQQGKQWEALADAFEALSPSQRGMYLGAWLDALERSKRWERHLQVCDSLLSKLDPDKQATLLKDLQRKRLTALIKLARHGEAALAAEALGDAKDPLMFILGSDHARLAKDFATMARLATKLLAIKPKDPTGLSLLGEALARQDRFQDAEPILREAVALNPRDGDAWGNLGRCLNEAKAWKEAESCLTQALILNPKSLEARYNRGRSLFELKRYAESKADFEAALELAPGDPVLAENLRQAARYATAEAKGKRPGH